MNYIVDIREEEELKQKRLMSKNPNVKIINVPTSMIKSQVDFIKSLTTNGKVYLGCRRGIRTNRIKNELFKNNDKIISMDAIDNAPKLFDNVILITPDDNSDNLAIWLIAGIGILVGINLFKN